VLLEQDRADVGQVDDHVDDGEIGVGELLATFSARWPGRSRWRPRVVAAAGEAAQGLLALAVVLDLEVAVLDAGLGLELLGAGIGGLVEALVELAAEVVDDGRLDVGRPTAQSPSGSGANSPSIVKKRPIKSQTAPPDIRFSCSCLEIMPRCTRCPSFSTEPSPIRKASDWRARLIRS
jgi:hypothetical protein